MRLAIILLVLLVGCRDYDVERRCLPDEQRAEDRAAFVLQCAVNANPKSDEEPEDMLKECDRIARDTFCDRVWAVKCSGDRCGTRWEWIACMHADSYSQQACIDAGRARP